MIEGARSRVCNTLLVRKELPRLIGLDMSHNCHVAREMTRPDETPSPVRS
jgi:hypothetical protein